MNPPLSFLRYLLLAAPAVALPFSLEIDSYSLYVYRILILLGLVRFQEKASSERLRIALFVGEIGFSAWLLHVYGGLLYLVFWSLAAALFERKTWTSRLSWLALIAVVMNGALLGAESGVWLSANLGLLTVAAALQRSIKLEVNQDELMNLYDELRKKHYELEEARQRILEYAGKVENSAQTEERNRIARDLHDDLGHKLIRQKMMLEAVLHIMPAQPDKAMELIRQVRDQLTASMETMRKTVRRLKPEEADVHAWSLDRLVEELSREPGLRVQYHVEGSPVALYPSCEITLYRNLQEAITNAIRHGEANEVSIALTYGERNVSLAVSNNGRLPERINQRGLGLSGMEERTRLVGGELDFCLEERFTVITRIPLIRD